MHPHDEVIEAFETLKPHLFTSFVRLDLSVQYSWDIFEQESLLQIWLLAEDEQITEKKILHLSCYGIERRQWFDYLWPHNNPLQIRMKSIRQHYLHGLFFEMSCYESGYDEYNPLFACRRFEACREEDEQLQKISTFSDFIEN